MEKHRNFIEYGIIMNMNKISICQQDDLDKDIIQREFTEDFPCHIYFIIARPRITIVPEKCEFNEMIKLVFKIQLKHDFIEREILLYPPLNFDLSNAKIDSSYPHSTFRIIVDDNEILFAKSSVYYTMHTRNHTEEFDAELLYIGQSYGKKRERKVSERLKNHSTLQKIYSEISQNNPDREIWLNLLSFEQTMNMSFDGLSGTSKRKENDVQNAAIVMQKFTNNEFNEKEIINFTEAALIKYFRPKYNVVFKDIFPSIDHKSYKEAIDLDVNCVAFELDTQCINLKLYTDEVKPNFSNMVTYTFKSKQNRKNLFDMFDHTLIPKTYSNIKIE
jgi:hypothetical protein